MPRGSSVVALVALVAGIAGCATTVDPETLREWVGRPATALAEAWGPPTREARDGAGRVLIYEEIARAQRRDFQNQEHTMYRRQGAYEARTPDLAPRVYVRSYLFWVDEAGTIVRADVHQP